ncbi:MAG: hypothetical protein QOK22_858 [Gaiellaceae bacterium]|jgi:hypothetical protein|nr:hypothetical protein [Gaiellaceae bacterium]
MHGDIQQEALAAIIDEARAEVAAGRAPDEQALAARIRTAGGGTQALEQLERVLAIQRARARLAAPPAPPPAPAPARPRGRAAFRAQPTITGNMEVRRARSSDAAITLAWDAAPAVTAWDVRFSERADARSDYAVREERTLPAATTTLELELGELPLRVHILGRGSDGRLVRRAIVSALTRDNWDDRWQRRASAS